MMMPQEIVTSIQEGIKLKFVLIDYHGLKSICGPSDYDCCIFYYSQHEMCNPKYAARQGGRK